MKNFYGLVILLIALRGAEQIGCKYGGRGSLMSVCTDVTSAYFKTTTYRFTHLDEQVLCVNCTLNVIGSNNFDFYDNRIKVLDLTNCQINQLNTKSFIGLIFMEKLYLTLNKIQKIQPQTFAGINKIQFLDLRDNEIVNLVNDGFKELLNLKTLLLQNNKIKSIEQDAFNQLSSLETLDLSKNNVIVVKGVFNKLSSLKLLNLEQNLVTELQSTDLANAQSLIQLNLANNLLKSVFPDTFLQFSHLETLNLSSNPVEAIGLGSFRGLLALEELDLNNCSIPEVPKGSLLALHNLRLLDLSRNKIKIFKTGIYSGLPELRKLNLSYNKIDSYMKTGVFSLNRLHTFDLSNNNLHDLDYKSLVNHMPALAYLGLSNNPWRCFIAKEIEEEFVHDNLHLDLGERIYDASIKCNDSRASYTKEIFEPETAPLILDPTGHQYVLYVFILISMGVMAYMYYMACTNHKNIKEIIDRNNLEARFLNNSTSLEVNAKCDSDY